MSAPSPREGRRTFPNPFPGPRPRHFAYETRLDYSPPPRSPWRERILIGAILVLLVFAAVVTAQMASATEAGPAGVPRVADHVEAPLQDPSVPGTWTEVCGGEEGGVDYSPHCSPTDLRNGSLLEDVYDPVDNEVVTTGWFGPVNGIGEVWGNGTWAWSGGTSTTTWTNISLSSHSPAARNQYSMAWDPSLGADGEVLLFGGYCDSVDNEYNIQPCGDVKDDLYYNDTWEFVGQKWTQITTANYPGGAGNAAIITGLMVWDPVDDYELYFGGINGTNGGNPSTQTWAFYGGNWHELDPTGTPTSTSSVGNMVWDTADGYALYCNQNGSTDKDACWRFVGDEWLLLHTVGGWNQHGLEGFSMVYDPAKNIVVTFGGDIESEGTYAGVLADVWYYSGGVWTNVTAQVATEPLPRIDASMAVNPTVPGFVMNDGQEAAATLGDTWIWTPEITETVSAHVVGTVTAGQSALLNATTADGATNETLDWQFGGDAGYDDTSADQAEGLYLSGSDRNPTPQWDEAGTYQGSVFFNSSMGHAIGYFTVTVVPSYTLKESVSGPTFPIEGQTATYEGKAALGASYTGPYAWSWHFDGAATDVTSSGSVTNVSLVWPSAGVYELVAFLNDTNSAEASVHLNVTVQYSSGSGNGNGGGGNTTNGTGNLTGSCTCGGPSWPCAPGSVPACPAPGAATSACSGSWLAVCSWTWLWASWKGWLVLGVAAISLILLAAAVRRIG